MSALDARAHDRLHAAARRRAQALAGALDAVALARTRAERSAHALRAEVSTHSTNLSAEAAAVLPPNGRGGWGPEVAEDRPWLR